MNIKRYLLICASAVLITSGANAQVIDGTNGASGGGGGGGVTAVGTTGPITGGTITTSGTIACATCVTSAAALTANQVVVGSGSQGEAVLASPGTTTTLLHGNAAGAPSFSAVGLTTDVTGVLPAANGGAGTINGALKSNGSGTVSQAACADLSNGASGCSTAVGTIATQNANAVAITGGTINTATVGATTPAAGTFSTLKDTGITGSTQCVHADTTGALSGTGSDCGSGGGGSVSVTAATPDIVITPSPGTGTFTIGTTVVANTQSGASYTILSSDAGKVVERTNTGGAQTDTLPNVSTSGFGAGFGIPGYCSGPVSGAQQITISVTSPSTINGSSTLVIPANTCVTISDPDGSNYVSVAQNYNATLLTSGTVPAARGGAGTINGALKGNGSGTVSQAACADLSNAATSCSTDATNATNIASGTLPAARITSDAPYCEAWITGTSTITPANCGTASAGTWTAPSWVTSTTWFHVEVLGPGGSGGGCSTASDIGGSGSPGGLAVLEGKGLITASTGYSFVVGAGGSAISANTNSAGNDGAADSTMTIGGTTPTGGHGLAGVVCTSGSGLVQAGSGSNGTINVNGGATLKRGTNSDTYGGAVPFGLGITGQISGANQGNGSGFGYGGVGSFSTTAASQAGGNGVIHIRLMGQ